MNHVVQEHYRRLASQYDEFLRYSPDFVRRLTRKMVEMLDLRPQDTLADLGAGTGMYTADILEQVPLENPVLAVEPFQEMLDRMPKTPSIKPVLRDALSFSAEPAGYNKVLMKEAIHHVEDKERLAGHLHQNLPSGGRVLLVHVPPRIAYPLFQKALERSSEWHADPAEIMKTFARAGFSVEREGLDYRHSLPREHYFRMVEARYMSVLSSFSDDEIRDGLEEMGRTYAGIETLEFTDHFDYILATKS